MQKFIALSLLVMSSSIHAMENYSFWRIFSFFSSFVCSNQVVTESELIQGLRIRKNKFEEQLQLDKLITEYMDDALPWEHYEPERIDSNPVEFLKFCYWKKLQYGVHINRFDEPSLLHKCKDARIDGYSALGAAIIAKDSYQHKANFILALKDRGYTLTEKDKELLVLEFYDSIPVKDKEIMICMLYNHKMSDLSVLPYDVREYIVKFMIYGLKARHISVMDMGKHHQHVRYVIDPMNLSYT